MRRITLFSTLVFAFGIGAVAHSWRPRTLGEKVQEANLVIEGTASLIGEETIAVTNFGPVLYKRNLRVDVSRVLWPPGQPATNISFRSYFMKTWPASWWAYTNTPGVFFLTKNPRPQDGEWTGLGRFDDWMEPATNAPLVVTAIQNIKTGLGTAGRQQGGAANRSQPVGPHTNRVSTAVGSSR